ncbi:MAG: DUF6879 family protein [Pseudonocardiaceae bacterium]
MIKVLRDLSCPNTLDCNKIYGLEDGRRAVRGDKPDAALLAEMGPLPDHEGVVIVEAELLPELREVLTLDQLGEFVAKHHTRDLFRLETLPFYNAVSDDDDFGRYLRGEPAPSAEAKQPWLDRIRADVAAGRAWRRIHAVTHPLADYVRYECEWGYVPNSAAGEQVRIAELTSALAQVGDFFVLDGEHVIRSHYDETCKFVGAEVLSDPYSAAPLVALAELLWNQATDFAIWWDAHPGYHRDTRVA